MSASSQKNRYSRLASARVAFVLPVLFGTFLLCACPKKEWHYTPPPVPTPTDNFDVQYDPAMPDPNGVPRSVNWQPQLSGHIPNPDDCNNGQPYSSTCTQDKPFQDQPDGVHEAFCFIGKAVSGSPYQSFFGHADWMVAQFNGSIGWYNFGDDWDYDLFLIPGNDHLPAAPFNVHGITTNNNHVADDSTNPQYIEMEFDSNETNSAFTKGWWNQFMTLGEQDDVDNLAQLFHPEKKTLACGAAIGLFGLDCDHGCRSELHPIYGLAIQTKDEPDDNEWSIMARNWGTGGYCSQYNDELAETNMSLTLPYSASQPPTKVEVTQFAAAANDSSASVGCPTYYFQNDQMIVNLTLPAPEQQPVAAFTLKIQWPAGAQPIACTQPNPAEPAAMAHVPEHLIAPAKINGEDYMGALVRSAWQSGNPSTKHPNLEKDILPIAPKSQTRMQSVKPMMMTRQTQPCEGTITMSSGPPHPAPLKTVHRLQKNPRKQIRDDAIRTYVCRTFRTKHLPPPTGSTQQDLDLACKGVK